MGLIMVGQSGCELVDSARDAELALRVRGAPLSATTSNGDGPDGSEAAAAPHLGENVSRFGGGTARFPSTGCYDQRRRRVAPPCRSVHGTCLWMGLLALPRREKRIAITFPGATTRHDRTI